MPTAAPPPRADHQELAAQAARTERYLAEDPDNPRLLTQGCELALLLGDPDAALRYAERGLALQPGDPHFAFRRARALAARGDWAVADAEFARLLAAHRDPYIACALAQSKAAQGEHALALAALEPFADDPALDAAGATLLVRALHHAGRVADAVAYAQRHEARHADSAAFLAAAAMAHLDQEQLADAARLSRRAQELGGAGPEALVVDASLALAEADAPRAAQLYRSVLERYPEEGRSWTGLGTASVLARDFAAAGPQLEQARRLMPHHIGTMHMLGWCRIFTGNLDGAEREFEAALAEDRNFGESHGGMAVVHALRGARGAADEAAERALRLDPDSLAAVYARMILAGETADPQRFQRLALKVLSRHTLPGGGDLASVVRRHLPS